MIIRLYFNYLWFILFLLL